ncbi:MAG: DUF3054 domain-containing protein [Chloroflexales bacterium]|nr:DUF3054 domain-containing protein [Chloroflexales bacterium]
MEHLQSSVPAPQTQGGRDWRVVWLVVGDLIAFLVFAAIGRRSHGAAAGLGALLEVAWTAAPFIAGWLLTAPFVGAYRREHTLAPGPMLKRTALAWLAAWPVGLALRALFLSRSIPLSFAIVTLISNAIIICGWRGVFAWMRARRTT